MIEMVLATWRITSLLVYEDGPFNAFRNLRDKVGVGLEKPSGKPLTFLGGLLGCFWCTSVWVAAAVVATMAPVYLALCLMLFYLNTVTAVVAFFSVATWSVMGVFAASGGAIALESVIRYFITEREQ